jgi:hypothetical protein
LAHATGIIFLAVLGGDDGSMPASTWPITSGWLSPESEEIS